MKNSKIVLILSILTLSASTRGVDIFKTYAVDREIKSILDMHSDEIFAKIKKVHTTTQWHGVWQFEWLPGYYIKYGLDRIKGVERIRHCIEAYKLDLLTTPDKRLYHIKGQPTELSSLNYAVIIKEVEATDTPQPLTLEHVKQLCTIIHKADYIDMTSTNYIKMANGKLCLIDTEGIFNASKRIKGFLRMIGTLHNLNTNYTQEALKHIFFEIKQELRRRPDQVSFALPYLKRELLAQEQPYSWDYISYANSYFKELENT